MDLNHNTIKKAEMYLYFHGYSVKTGENTYYKPYERGFCVIERGAKGYYIVKCA